MHLFLWKKKKLWENDIQEMTLVLDKKKRLDSLKKNEHGEEWLNLWNNMFFFTSFQLTCNFSNGGSHEKFEHMKMIVWMSKRAFYNSWYLRNMLILSRIRNSWFILNIWISIARFCWLCVSYFHPFYHVYSLW